MDPNQLKEIWKQEEAEAHVRGWDFSHIDGRCEESPLPWDYRNVIGKYLQPHWDILDYDTGGGEFLLSLRHPHEKTAATEGYLPNVALCEKTLLPLGIDFKACNTPENIPFSDGTFDLILNRHGSFCAEEIYRLLKEGGLFITQQVGEDNDRDLVELVLPHIQKTFPGFHLEAQKKAFQDAGFQILEEGESFRPIRFYDVGAFVWFARIIQWEFPTFSVDGCFESLLKMQKTVEEKGYIEGTVHRYYLVAKK